MVRKKQKTIVEELQPIAKPLKIKSSLTKRPYGLCAEVGISTYGLSPGEAWSAWNDYRRRAREEKKSKKGKKRKSRQSIVTVTPKAQPAAVKHAPKPSANIKLSASKPKEEQAEHSGIKIPELSAAAISLANSNSQYDRGSVSERAYKEYANKILSMSISDAKKEKLLADLKKRWDKLLGYQAAWVPVTVAGPARYNAKKLDKGDQVMRTRSEIQDWFKGVEKSIENSKSQYKDNSAAKAKKEEEWLNRAIENGWYRTPTDIATGLAAIAPHDTARFVELYEQYDKKYHFRKNTNAAKLYERVKAGTYTGEKQPQKLHETENLNTYTKNIQAGERVFMKFTTRPKPQLIYALKRRGWHWNANEEAWSIDSKKYDKEFIEGIDENYKKYL